MKYIFILMVVICCTTYTVDAQQKVIHYEKGRKTAIVDSLRDGLIKFDTITRKNSKGTIDTLLLKKSLIKIDSIIKNGILADNAIDSTQSRDSVIKVDSYKIDTTFLRATTQIQLKGKNDKGKEGDKKKFSLTQDTLKAGRLTLLSLAPGVGQIYNRQPWKIPVIYGAMGGFVTGGVISSGNYKSYKTEWERTVNLNLPQSLQDEARSKMQRAGTMRTLYFGAAAATYLYQVADATFNYRGNVDHIRQATTLAAVFPGAGFIYTKTYWRLPIYYGGIITCLTVVDYNNRYYHKYYDAYNAMTDGDPTTVPDPTVARHSAESLKNARDAYRRNRDLGLIGLAGIYILNIIDTHVIATLKNWDVSPDLSMTIEPTIINNTIHRASAVPSGVGMSLKIKF